MQKTALGKTGMEISRVVFGGIIVMDEEQKDADRYVASAVDSGVNYFDVAPSYGNSEEKLGPALKPYRNKVFLACKTMDRTAAGAREQLHDSLSKLKTDYFDLYQMHSFSTLEDLSAFEENGAMEALLQAKKEGLIRNIGITSHDEEVALAAFSKFDFASIMFPVNWSLGLSKNMGKQLEEHCIKNQTGFLGMKTLAHRSWQQGDASVYPKSWCKTIFDDDRLGVCALKYTLSCGVDAVVPPGNFDQFSFAVSNIEECLKNPLSEEDTAYLRYMLPNEKDLFFVTSPTNRTVSNRTREN